MKYKIGPWKFLGSPEKLFPSPSRTGRGNPADVFHGRRHENQTVGQLLKMQTLRRRRCYNQG